ncbi:MAG: hypothetical protein AAFQ67_09840 [Pseudomonadota bacterium]
MPALFDPIEAAAFSSETHFKTTASELGLADLKRIMRQWNLATPVDMRGLKKDAIVAMMYDRAVLKIAERGGATG